MSQKEKLVELTFNFVNEKSKEINSDLFLKVGETSFSKQILNCRPRIQAPSFVERN